MSDEAAERDAGFQKALGLRGLHDVMRLKVNTFVGKSFAEALVVALLK